MQIRYILTLLLLAAIWGGSFIFMRILSPAIGPLPTATGRVLIGGLALAAYFRLTNIQLFWRRYWHHYLLIGLINSAIPFSLFAYGALFLPTAYSAVLNSTAPFYSALLAALWLQDPLTIKKGLGLLLGIFGVALVARLGSQTFVSPLFSIGFAACGVAAFCYGVAGVYIQKFGLDIPSQGIACGTQIMASLSLLPVALTVPHPWEWSASVALALAGLSLICSAFAYVLYFWLMQKMGPTRALSVTFLIPVFGMAWGFLFLSEPVSIIMLIGAGLIGIGTYFVLAK